MLDIIGGSYIEKCVDPMSNELYGSGLRAAAALSKKGFKIVFHSCICKEYESLAILSSNTFGYTCDYSIIPETIAFNYYHPLSHPIRNFEQISENIQIKNIEGRNILYYGMLEATAVFNGDFVVYDPQNQKKFSETGSTAKHLALVLNKNEALLFSRSESIDLVTVGKNLLLSEDAEVVIIKNGAHGALLFEDQVVHEIPIFETDTVWPIGSGDIFSASFAWKWMIEGNSAHESALKASQFTAQYCQYKQLPLVSTVLSMKALAYSHGVKNIYLAGPFFSISERWLINELRNILIQFGNNVFSPFHDVGLIESEDIRSSASKIAKKDLEGIFNCDTVLAVISGLDAGTLFEIGYARSLNKKIVILSENVSENDLTMIVGTGCEITNDFSTAIYKASW